MGICGAELSNLTFQETPCYHICSKLRVLVMVLLASIASFNKAAIGWSPIAADMSSQANATVSSSISGSLRGRLYPLKVGTTYIGHNGFVPSQFVPTYFFFSSKLTGPVYQGVVSEEGINGLLSLIITESKKVYALGEQSFFGQRIYTMSYNTLTEMYTLISRASGWNLAGTQGVASAADGSERLFLLRPQDSTLRRWDAATGFSPTFATTLYNNCPWLTLYQSTVLVFGSTNTVIQFVSQTDMTIVSMLSGSRRGDFFQVDDLNSTVLYIVSNPNPYTLSYVDIGGIITYSEIASRNFPMPLLSKVVLFGLFQSIGLFTSDTTFNLYEKKSLEAMPAAIWAPKTLSSSATLYQNSLSTGSSNGLRFPLLMLAVNSRVNFNSYYIYMDYCTRDTDNKCASCPEGYYKIPSSDDCFPEFQGNWDGSTLKSCATSNCIKCDQDATVCELCTDKPFKLYLLNNVCVPSAVPGYGPLGDTLVPCTDQHCIDCSAVATSCTRCGSTTYLLGRTCINFELMQRLRLGDSGTGFEAKPCAVPQCLSCIADYTKCTLCDSSNGYLVSPDGGSCQDTTLGLQESRILTTYDLLTETITMQFRGPIQENVTDAHFSIRLEDAADFRAGINCSSPDSQVIIRIKQVDVDNIIFDVITEKQIIDGRATFSSNSEPLLLRSASGIPLEGFPTTAKEVQKLNVVEGEAIIETVEVVNFIANVIRTPLMISLSLTGAAAGTSPNYVFSQQLVLAMLEGPEVLYADSIMFNTIKYIQDFPPMPNIFSLLQERGDDECMLPIRWTKLSLGCSFLLNFGAPLLGLTTMYCLMLCAKLLLNKINSKEIQRSLSTAQTAESKSGLSNSKRETSTVAAKPKQEQGFTLARILEKFQLPFFLSNLETFLAELFLFAFINLTTDPDTLLLRFGYLASVAVILGMSWLFLTTLSGAFWLRRQSLPHSRTGQTIGKVVDLEKAEYPALLKRYEELCCPANLLGYLQPVADYIRAMLTAVVIVIFKGSTLIQIAGTIAIQSLFMANYVMLYSAKSQKDKWLTIWIESQFLAYMLMKLLVLYETDENRVQNVYGLIMAILLVTTQMTAVLVSLYEVIITVYDIIKSRNLKLKQQPEPLQSAEGKLAKPTAQLPPPGKFTSKRVLMNPGSKLLSQRLVLSRMGDKSPTLKQPALLTQSTRKNTVHGTMMLIKQAKAVGRLASSNLTKEQDGNIIPSSSLVSPDSDISHPRSISQKIRSGSPIRQGGTESTGTFTQDSRLS